MVKGKIVVGLTENVTIIGPKGKRKRITSRIDTGATKSSVDAKLAAELSLGPIIKTKLIKSASGNKMRPVLKAEIKIAKKDLKEEFTVADRSHLRYKVLVGQNILKKGFLIDPSKK
ncbi:RimK/LysX family protein [Candidatus Woesearchaeota archaeon]|nr:RimK/LysX family protein [Candidatus Woesearchaeota archaeon]